MARNKNVGRTTQNNAGLVLQSKSELDTNEWGLIQCSLKFNLKSGLFPSLRPEQGTPCPAFVAGSDRTESILNSFSFMGAQTSKHIINGNSPGVDTLEVLCQGAIFDDSLTSNYRITRITVDTRGSGYDEPPDVDIDNTFEIAPAVATSRLEMDTISIVDGGSDYNVGDVITITGGSFDYVARLSVTAVTLGVITAAIMLNPGKYSVLPSNPCATTSNGVGTDATFDLTWRLGKINIDYGGEYSATPTVSLSGGTPAVAGTLRTPVMLQQVSGTNTAPFKPVTTVKDTVEFTTYATVGIAPPGAPPGSYEARIYVAALPTYNHIVISGIPVDRIYTEVFAPLDPSYTDGRQINHGDRVLFADGTAYAGLYSVTQPGRAAGYVNGQFQPAEQFIMDRVPELDSSGEISTSLIIRVNDGETQAGSIWQCDQASGTLNTTPLTFTQINLPGTAQYLPQYKVTIEYRAIELHFLYVASSRQSEPLFLLDEYALTTDGEIITDPLTGETTGLKIDSVTAIQQNVTIDPVTSQATVTDGAVVAIPESLWRAWVTYVGTASQFTQTPAGQFWSVEETTTVKIVSIPAAGSIEESS